MGGSVWAAAPGPRGWDRHSRTWCVGLVRYHPTGTSNKILLTGVVVHRFVRVPYILRTCTGIVTGARSPLRLVWCVTDTARDTCQGEAARRSDHACGSTTCASTAARVRLGRPLVRRHRVHGHAGLDQQVPLALQQLRHRRPLHRHRLRRRPRVGRSAELGCCWSALLRVRQGHCRRRGGGCGVTLRCGRSEGGRASRQAGCAYGLLRHARMEEPVWRDMRQIRERRALCQRSDDTGPRMGGYGAIRRALAQLLRLWQIHARLCAIAAAQPTATASARRPFSSAARAARAAAPASGLRGRVPIHLQRGLPGRRARRQGQRLRIRPGLRRLRTARSTSAATASPIAAPASSTASSVAGAHEPAEAVAAVAAASIVAAAATARSSSAPDGHAATSR